MDAFLKDYGKVKKCEGHGMKLTCSNEEYIVVLSIGGWNLPVHSDLGEMGPTTIKIQAFIIWTQKYSKI